MSRTFTYPSPITILNQDKEPMRIVERDPQGAVVKDEADRPWSLERALETFVFQLEEWRKPLRQSRMAHKILNAVEASSNNVVAISSEQYDALRKTLDSDEFEMPPHYSHQLVPLFDAILEAKEEGSD